MAENVTFDPTSTDWSTGCCVMTGGRMMGVRIATELVTTPRMLEATS